MFGIRFCTFQQRTCVLQWVAAVSVDLGKEHLPPYLPALLRPLFRELADSSGTAGKDLYNLAQEVVELMKNTSGREAFSRAYSEVHQAVLAVREKRRKQNPMDKYQYKHNYQINSQLQLFLSWERFYESKHLFTCFNPDKVNQG